jgi:hypothetical protein
MSKLICVAAVCAVMTSFATPAAHADSVFGGRTVAQRSNGGIVGQSNVAAQGSRGTFRGLRGVVSDGEGNVSGATGSAFATAGGGQGSRSARFDRTSDGAITATGQASASGANGSADRSGSFTKSADGAASGERSTTLTNANTGVTFAGSTTYTKGAGFSRSASCKDAAGNTVSCGSR